LPAAFAEGAAYGDIVAAALVLLTLALLPGRLGIVAAWVSDRERWPMAAPSCVGA